MKLSSDNKKSLDAIREKIVAKSTQYSEDEMIKLNAVFGEVLTFTGNRPRKVDLSCQHCINEAVGVLYNYVTYHEPATPVHRPTIVREVKPEDERVATTFDAKETTLTNLETGEKEAPVKKTRRPRTVKPKSK